MFVCLVLEVNVVDEVVMETTQAHLSGNIMDFRQINTYAHALTIRLAGPFVSQLSGALINIQALTICQDKSKRNLTKINNDKYLR